MPVSERVSRVTERLAHELPVGDHNLGNALQRLALDLWVLAGDELERDLLAAETFV